MKKNDILILLAQDCPDICLTWGWGDFELQVEIVNNEATYFLANHKDMKIIKEGTLTDIKQILRIIENGSNQG